MKKKVNRRTFIKKAAGATALAALSATSMSARSYRRIIGANERVNFAMAGLRSRANGLLDSIAICKNTHVSHICDVDTRELAKFSARVVEKFGDKPQAEQDIRKVVAEKDVDALVIATPDHWHAPMTIMGVQNGKHVYVEKPCSHNPHEGELLLKASKRYGKLIQMGNQQRSGPHTREVIKRVHEGLLGHVYMGKAWYSNRRGSIGVGKEVPVPDYLNWELFQGPAPREAYRDNVHPYNWHWFWTWGTGETLNNGTHEVDVCLWALQAGYPKRVTSSGGRYHYKDDWQFYDTLVTNFEYDDKMITWESRSCQGMGYFKRGRGVTIHGTEGTLLLDRDGFEVYNLDEELVERYSKSEKEESMGLVGGGPMTTAHLQNLLDAIRTGAPLHSPIEEGNVSVTMLHLSNIAWKVGSSLDLDPGNGHILYHPKAKSMWSREYEKGWEPKLS